MTKQEQYETSCPTISQNMQPLVNVYFNSSTRDTDLYVSVPFESYALYQLSFSENEISEYSNVIYNLTFPNSEGAVDAAQLCYDQLTYLNLSYWDYRVDSCNYINWHLRLPEPASIFDDDNPAIWITTYNKNGGIIQKTLRYLKATQIYQIQPQQFDIVNQIDEQLPQVQIIDDELGQEYQQVIIPSYVNVSSIDVTDGEIIDYSVNQQQGIIINMEPSFNSVVTIHYYLDNIQQQSTYQFSIQHVGVDPESLYYQSIYPQLNISIADDKIIVSNISSNMIAYKCNDSDTKVLLSNNMTISKKCEILTIYYVIASDNQIVSKQEYTINIGTTYQLYGNYVHRKGDITSSDQVMPGTVCNFVNHQRYLYEKSLSSDSVSGTATVIGGIAAAAGAALLKGEL